MSGAFLLNSFHLALYWKGFKERNAEGTVCEQAAPAQRPNGEITVSATKRIKEAFEISTWTGLQHAVTFLQILHII